jgi:glycosyltransferase involved in cell wall biosynthesis/FMN phosphatase YigB (HAD superfamily)
MNTVAPQVRVAVITRTKDRPILLRRAIESVLAQSCDAWVHVIINDGGKPGSVDFLVAEYAQRYRGRVIVIHNPQSVGMQNASNLGIRESRSDFVTIHDDDDSWDPEFLKRCVAHLDGVGADSSVQGVATHATWVNEGVNAEGEVVEYSRAPYFPRENITLFEMAAENLFPPIAFLYRRSVHQEIGYFNEQFAVLGDWDFNLRFLRQFDIDVIKEPLALYHWRHQGGGSVYGNTVTAGLSLHTDKRAKLYNHYLREDIEAGKSGLGFLMNVARPVHELAQRVDSVIAAQGETHRKVHTTMNHAEHLNRITKDLARLWQFKDSVAWGAAVLRSRLGGGTAAPRAGRGHAGQSRIQQFIKGMGKDSVLSLDVFDTALLRLVKRPGDVFVTMEPEVERLLGITGTSFAQARRAAEIRARQHYAKDDNAEVTHRQIYEMFSELSGVASQVSDQIRALEIATERQLCYANPVILALYQEMIQKGGRVVFVSDMYLPDEVVRELLRLNGFEKGDVFVSASRGKTKQSGALFREVLDSLGCAPALLFHMGDNAQSDFSQPQAMGIPALHVGADDWGGSVYSDQHVSQSGTVATEGLSSLCTGLARRHAYRAGQVGQSAGTMSLWDKIGYEIAGPLMYSFVQWIHQQARQQGIETLFFLSRDGYYLEQAFRKCSQKWGVARTSVYMYSSRRLLNIARIQELDEPSLAFLLSPNPDLRVRDVGERIGLERGLYAEAVEQAGMRLDQVITSHHGAFVDPATQGKLRALLQRLEAPILALAAGERQKLQSYFHDIGFSPGPIAIVDLGWQASSIRSLQELLNLDGGDFRLRGYYFGTWKLAQPALDAGCLIDSFFFHLDKPEPRAHLTAECPEMVEHFFTAPHPTVVGLNKEGSRWNPVYGGWEMTEAQRHCMARMSASALRFVDDMLGLHPTLGEQPPPFSYLESVLERILLDPRGTEQEELGLLPHRDSFGGSSPWRYLAKPPAPWRRVVNPRSLQAGYDYAYWKKGFLAQLGEAEKSRIRR